MSKITSGFSITTLLLIFSFYTYNYCHKTKKGNTKETIAAIMNYQMPQVINRCKKEHNYTDQDMIILEQELKKYLALSAVKTKEDLGTGMFSHDVDNLWHAFILFTPEYAEFCNNYIGHFIHHAPEINEHRSPEQQEEARKDFQAFVKNYEETFGEEVHAIWFLDMC
jgi:hypothetical protein